MPSHANGNAVRRLMSRAFGARPSMFRPAAPEAHATKTTCTYRSHTRREIARYKSLIPSCGTSYDPSSGLLAQLRSH